MTAVLQFEPAQLLAEASRQADNLTDFGDPSFRTALDKLCFSLEHEARLSELGRQLLHGKLVELLVNRLRTEDYFQRHPEIEQEIIAAPLVIVGLPRTGTTLLQRLLACDPQFYSMPWWESRYPVPFPGESLQSPTQRVERARGEVAVMVEAMPKLLSIHPMDADQADEEVMLMEHSFMAAFNAYAHLPSYMDWLHSTDEKPAYDYLKRMLKFLQWQKRQRGINSQRWVLKAPHHLLRMKLLLAEFPGAKVIQTHRDPVDTIPSIASFIDTLWHIYGSDVDPAAAGLEWNALMARAFKATMAVRDVCPDTFHDVRFEDTVKRPMEVVHDIYKWAGLMLSPTTEQAMQKWLEDNRRGTRHAHEYASEHFGLNANQIKRDFAEYRARHIDFSGEG
jgi:hypothetical protein